MLIVITHNTVISNIYILLIIYIINNMYMLLINIININNSINNK